MIAPWQTWTTIALLAVITFVIKGLGPGLLGQRAIPPRLLPVVVMLPAALLTGLVVAGTVPRSAGGGLEVDPAQLSGVAVAALALVLRLPLAVVLIGAVATTAAVRALT